MKFEIIEIIEFGTMLVASVATLSSIAILTLA